MKLSRSLPLLLLGLTLALVLPARAQINEKMQESIVRIICPEPATDGSPGLDAVHVKMDDGSTADLVDSSFGTGFVINNQGYIATNNHVVAPDANKEEPEKLVLVVQKIGARYLMHKAKVLWQSANRDVAIIQCPDLKADPLPFLFDEAKLTASEEVFSMGFPSITDIGTEDLQRSNQLRERLIIAQAENNIAERSRQLRRPLTQPEKQQIYDQVSSRTSLPNAERNAMLGALDSVMRQNQASTTTWDITNAVERKSLWKNYFTPTVTKGNIEQISKRHGVLGTGYPDVLTIQHSCAIKHGNSGGPLLNAGGQVIGIVGRGNTKMASGDRESIEWAAASSELKGWLDTNRVAYITGKEFHRQALPVKIIIAIALAVAVALVALILGLVKFNQKPSFTTIMRDPRMAKVLGTTHSKLVDAADSTSLRTTPGPLPGFGKWQLVGRTPKGDSVRVEITDVMFTTNDNRLILGRTAELCHVVVKDDSVSKQHASIRKDGDRFLVADRNSSNRTAVNGQFNTKTFDEVPLKEGDTLTLGEVRLDFSKV